MSRVTPNTSYVDEKNRSRESSGIEGLDDILGGGLPSNRLYVVEGDPGSGKTTLALQFLREGVRQGQRVLYVTLSETLEELADVAMSHGWTLDGIDFMELNSLSQNMSDDAAYTVFHPVDVELGDTVKAIRAEVERLNPQRVALDSVSELKILSQTSVRYRREVLGLKQFFAGRNCTVLVLDDLTSPKGEQQLQSIAHGVVCLDREEREYGSTRRQVRIVKMRGVCFHDGRHDFAIQSGGIQVYPRIRPKEGVTMTPDSVVSGIPAMDLLIGGGLQRGTSTLLLGPAGSGKTTLCSQYLMTALERGEQVCCFEFEESRETFLHRSKGFGMDFQKYLDSGKFHYEQVNISELSPGEFAARVRCEVEEKHATFIVIDSLNGYLNGMPSERFLLIHLHELLTYLGRHGVVTLLTVAQHGMMGSSMHTPVDVSFLADTVILLRFFEALGTVRQAIAVVKRRGGAHERTLREYKLGSEGLQVGEVLHGFQGVLTGVPRFAGDQGDLLGGKKSNVP